MAAPATSPLSIAVCGAGPGGLACAALLARQGHAVRILERFPEAKPVGSGLILQPAGLAVLDTLGAGPAIRALGRPLRRLFGKTVGRGRITLDVRYAALGDGREGLAVHRSALFLVLEEAARGAGVSIATGRSIASVERTAGLPVLLDATGARHGPFHLVVDATGSRSVLADQTFGPHHEPLPYGALWANVPWPGPPFDADALQQRYAGAHTMAGVLPIGCRAPGGPQEAAFFWSLRSDGYPAWRQRGMAAWKADVRALWPETAPILAHINDSDSLVFARYGHHTLPRFYSGRVAFLGDAAHATSPQLGQGANMALLDALALATALQLAPAGLAPPVGAPPPDVPAALPLYDSMRRRHVRLYQGMSRAFTPFYQSDSRLLPVVRDALFGPVYGLPFAPRLIASLVAGAWAAPLDRIRHPQ